MALNAKNIPGGGGNYEPMEPGTYPARVVQIIDLGLQNQRPFQGQEKPPAREIAITYEFVDEFMKDENGEDQEDKPRWLTEIMPLHNLSSERAKSTQRYNALDPNMVYDGDFSQLVDTPCNVTVVQNPGKGKNAGRIYENVTAVSAMRARDAKKCPELVNEPIVFDCDEPDMDSWEKLPAFVKNKIRENLEFTGSDLEKMVGKGDESPGKKENKSDTQDDLDDEVPY